MDLNVFSDWCTNNKLHLNINKCKVISFSRTRDPFIVPYHIYSFPLLRVHEISDLGVIFNSTLTYNKPLSLTYRKSSMILSFITRNCKNFTNPVVIKILFTSLVHT